MKRIPLLRKTATAMIGSVAILGCAQSHQDLPVLAGANDACDPQTAQILVGDGFQRAVCGCAEPAGEIVQSTRGSLTCTVSAGKWIVFHYVGSELQHQIVPRDGASFSPSPISDPSDSSPLPTWVFEVAASGTYEYFDLFDSGLVGRIVVQ